MTTKQFGLMMAGTILLICVAGAFCVSYANKRQPKSIAFAEKQGYEVIGFSTQKYGENESKTMALFQVKDSNGLILLQEDAPQIIEMHVHSDLASIRGFRKKIGARKFLHFKNTQDFSNFNSYLQQTSDDAGSCSTPGDICKVYVFN